MKKLLAAAMLLIWVDCFSQANILIGVNNEGLRLGAGFVQEETGAGIALHHNFPLISSEKPNVTVLSALYEWRNEGGWNVTGLIGGAFHSYTNAGKYLGYNNKTTLSYGIEIGKDWHMGRLFISSSYSGVLYIGGGMKVMFK